MDFSYSSTRSLKDTLLEYVVLNSDDIFPPLERLQGNEPFCNLQMAFPSHLFDEVLAKSKDIFWNISTESLISCVVHREKLNWNGLCQTIYLSPSEIKLIVDTCRDKPPIKYLCAYVIISGLTDLSKFDSLSKTSGVLEYLNLTITLEDSFKNEYLTRDSNYSTKVQDIINRYPSFKLKQLHLEAELMSHFPFRSDSLCLQVLQLRDSRLTVATLKSMKNFKNLMQLSLIEVRLDANLSLKEVLDVVMTFVNLRILNLRIQNIELDEEIMNRILTALINLEVLEVGDIKLNNGGSTLPVNRLKAFLYGRILSGESTNSERLNVLARAVGNLESLNGILTIIENATTGHDILRCLSKHALGDEMKSEYAFASRRLEQLVGKKSNEFLYKIYLMKTVCNEAILKGLQFSSNFMLKMASWECSSQYCTYVGKEMLDFVRLFTENNRDTNLAKSFLKLIDFF